MSKLMSTILVAALSTSVAMAKPPHAEENGKSQKEKHHKKKHKQSKKFSKTDRKKVQEYYRNLPPGLAKKMQRTGTLPPGWQTKVKTGQKLPESYHTELQPVPHELEMTLTPGPIGSEVMRIGDKIIRLEQATHMILDVFEF